MLVLGLDFETTGVDSLNDRVIEIGAVVWCLKRNKPVQMVNSLIRHAPDEKVVVSQDIQELTHILPEDIERCGISPSDAFKRLLELFPSVQYVIAHNGNRFDRKFLENELKRLKLPMPAVPWIDTMTDVPYPPEILGRSGEALRPFHGVTNLHPHRAVFDVLAMLEILSKYAFDDVVALSKIPLVTIRAKVGFNEKDKAKSRGYFWDKDTKSWLKMIKECHLEDEKKNAGFEVEIVASDR